MEPKTKQYLLVTVVGVTLFVALLRLSAVLAFAAKLIDLVLPILAGGILALFINVPMTGLEKRLKSLFRKSLVLLGAGGLVLTVLAEAFSAPLVAIFASYDAELYAMTVRGFRLYSLTFLIMGVNVWGSAFFTALNNGAISAAISFLRTFVFQVAVVLALPALIGLDGIWLAIVVAEALALLVTAAFLAAKREYYHYG